MERLQELLAAPDKVIFSDLEYIERVISKYPYFQAAQSIYLKCLKKNNSPLYNKQLQKTAAHTTDRSVLFDFITSVQFNQHQVSDHIKNRESELRNIEVTAQEVKTRSQDLNEVSDFSKVTDADLFQRKTDVTTAPLEFNKNESYSFNEWLRLSSLEPIQRDEENTTAPAEKTNFVDPEEEIRLKKMARIDQFLAEKPKIKPAKEKITLNNIDTSHSSSHQLMTETLAQVYAAQKNYDKAIKSYEILLLQHPEKSSFFADRIQQIKNLQSNS
jgi:tetratricopeptide (TPR) repeat protein